MRFGEEFREPEFESEEERNSMHVWILRLMHRYMSMDYRRITKMGVHPGQLPVLRAISEHEGISQRELAKEIHVKPPTIAVTIKRLEKAELVYRKADRADLRICRLYMTEKGKLLGKELMQMQEVNEQILTKGFTEEEVKQMKGYFNRVIENIKEAYEKESGE